MLVVESIAVMLSGNARGLGHLSKQAPCPRLLQAVQQHSSLPIFFVKLAASFKLILESVCTNR